MRGTFLHKVLVRICASHQCVWYRADTTFTGKKKGVLCCSKGSQGEKRGHLCNSEYLLHIDFPATRGSGLCLYPQSLAQHGHLTDAGVFVE